MKISFYVSVNWLCEFALHVVLQVKLHPNAASSLHLYVKRTESTTCQLPVKSTVEIRGLPPYVSRVAVKKLFGELAAEAESRVRVRFENELSRKTESEGQTKLSNFDKHFLSEEEPISSNAAVFVAYRGEEAVAKVLHAPLQDAKYVLYESEEQALKGSAQSALPIGVQSQFKNFNQRFSWNNAKLQSEIDQFMQEFDAKATRGTKRRFTAEDDDGTDEDAGWQTVNTKKAAKRTDVAQAAAFRRIATKQKQEHQAADFYRFQLRDSRIKRTFHALFTSDLLINSYCD